MMDIHKSFAFVMSNCVATHTISVIYIITNTKRGNIDSQSVYTREVHCTKYNMVV